MTADTSGINDVETAEAGRKPTAVPEWKAMARVLLAEALGTGIIVLVGCGSVCSTLSGAFSGIWQVAVVWGVGVTLAIYLTAEVSGAHLNPAVTLAFLLVRPQAHGMTVKKAGMYVAAQFLGAIVAPEWLRLDLPCIALSTSSCPARPCLHGRLPCPILPSLAGTLNYIIYHAEIKSFEVKNGIERGEPSSILSAKAFGEYFPDPGLPLAAGVEISPLYALLVEAWGTLVLNVVIFSVTHDRNKVLGDSSRPAVPAAIGSTVAILLALYAPITQAGWNPARDFGPRLVAAAAGWGSVAIPGPKNGFWIYIVGPCLGAPLGAMFSEWVLNQAPVHKA